MDQVIQILGAIAILVAFVGAQVGRLRPDSWPYLVLNLTGASVLAVLAWLDDDWGFLLLEGVWSAVSAWSILRKIRPARA